MLDERIDLPHTRGVTVTDQWLDFTVELSLVASGQPLVLPYRNGQPERGGIEGVYQSSAVIPHWHVTADEHGRWDVWIRWAPTVPPLESIREKSIHGRPRPCLLNAEPS